MGINHMNKKGNDISSFCSDDDASFNYGLLRCNQRRIKRLLLVFIYWQEYYHKYSKFLQRFHSNFGKDREATIQQDLDLSLTLEERAYKKKRHWNKKARQNDDWEGLKTFHHVDSLWGLRYFCPCLLHTPLHFALLVHPSMLQIFTFAPCLTHTPHSFFLDIDCAFINTA